MLEIPILGRWNREGSRDSLVSQFRLVLIKVNEGPSFKDGLTEDNFQLRG